MSKTSKMSKMSKMSKNACRLLGMLLRLVSVFFLLGGLFLHDESIPAPVAPICLVIGVLLLIVGTVFYKILKSNEP